MSDQITILAEMLAAINENLTDDLEAIGEQMASDEVESKAIREALSLLGKKVNETKAEVTAVHIAVRSLQKTVGDILQAVLVPSVNKAAPSNNTGSLNQFLGKVRRKNKNKP